jgi:hypothetical protein
MNRLLTTLLATALLLPTIGATAEGAERGCSQTRNGLVVPPYTSSLMLDGILLGDSPGIDRHFPEDVVIGDRCKIQNHVSLYRGVVLEDDVFVGPAVTFTNDLYPRARSVHWEVIPTRVCRGASVGANATVLCGVELGAWSMVGSGAVVTSDVPAHGLMIGAPARLRGWGCVCGRPSTAPRGAPTTTCASCDRERRSAGE